MDVFTAHNERQIEANGKIVKKSGELKARGMYIRGRMTIRPLKTNDRTTIPSPPDEVLRLAS